MSLDLTVTRWHRLAEQAGIAAYKTRFAKVANKRTVPDFTPSQVTRKAIKTLPLSPHVPNVDYEVATGKTKATSLFTVLMGLSYRKFKMAVRRLIHILTLPPDAPCPSWLEQYELALPPNTDEARSVIICDLLKAISQAVYSAYARRDESEAKWLIAQAEEALCKAHMFKRHVTLLDRFKVELTTFNALLMQARQSDKVISSANLEVVHNENGKGPSKRSFEVTTREYMVVKHNEALGYYLV